AAGVPLDGIKVFDDDVEEERPTPKLAKAPRAKPKPKAKAPANMTPAALPTELAPGAGTENFRDADERVNAIRNSPFTRAPRRVQVEWLRTQVMVDNGWHTAYGIGRDYANDERHFRYLRHAVGGRLREMHEDGIVDRRDSREKGAMYEYRLRKEG